MPKLNLPSRQIHLDFHTSPLISDLLTEWDAEAFADTMVRAHVNSVNLFAKCHHGMSYYPTEIGQPHPAMGARDLLGEQIAALHKRGIRTQIYYTVGWEQRLADLHPEWRQMRKDGRHARVETPPGVVNPDRWWFMSYLQPDYLEHMKREMNEIVTRYPVEGVWFDIVMYDAGAGYEDGVREIRYANGLRENSFENDQRMYALSRKLFAEAISPVVLKQHPDSKLFFNSAHALSIDADNSIGTVHEFQHHWEIESLPNGFWGYFHFPRFGRYVSTLNMPWLGMTGRFQRMWGDFGGIKPQAALEFECFRSQAHGGGNSIGDQLPPRGQL
ncbi:MAG: alpha-L-fucosidase, partial [Casimicrobium sp.]